MAISADVLRGHTDAIILARLEAGDSYGYEIGKAVADRSGGACRFKEATLYTAFKRLEQSGMIASYWGQDGPGARRRYYTITEAGRAQLEACRRQWAETKRVLDGLVEKED